MAVFVIGIGEIFGMKYDRKIKRFGSNAKKVVAYSETQFFRMNLQTH